MDGQRPRFAWRHLASYGKFLPDQTGTVNRRDDTGWGPFSGVTNYLTAGEEEFPGDDWISNPLGLPIPSGLALPLNLREKNASGTWRWTHVITIEPTSDRGEGVGSGSHSSSGRTVMRLAMVRRERRAPSRCAPMAFERTRSIALVMRIR
jgi:hypothetical protein